MAYLNKIMLIGTVGKEPEVRTGGSSSFATLTLATTKKYKSSDGQQKEQTTWHSLVVNGTTVNYVQNYVHKGDTIYVEGEMSSRQYTDKDGQNRVSYEVRVNTIQMLRSKDGQQGQQSRQDNGEFDLPAGIF